MDIATVDLLTTTRSVRKRLDLTRSVEPEILERCIEIAMQAPTALYGQTWHFMVVTDPVKKAGIAEVYRRVTSEYRSGAPVADRYLTQLHFIKNPNDPRFEPQQRMYGSSVYLEAHIHEVPVLVIPCVEGRMENEGPAAQASMYGSILPATWSLMLALRARGIGSAWTTLHLAYESEVAKLLGIPDSVTQAALLPIAYFKGVDFKPAKRLPARDRIYWNEWGHCTGSRQNTLTQKRLAAPEVWSTSK
jgi:nitroreductase